MVVAVVDVGPVGGLQSRHQVVQRLVFVDIVRDRIAVHFVHDGCLAANAKLLVEEPEPLDQRIVAGEVAKRHSVVRWLESHALQCLLCRDGLQRANSQI